MRSALDVECFKCGAAAGRRCATTTGTGRTTDTHAVRFTEAARQSREQRANHDVADGLAPSSEALLAGTEFEGMLPPES